MEDLDWPEGAHAKIDNDFTKWSGGEEYVFSERKSWLCENEDSWSFSQYLSNSDSWNIQINPLYPQDTGDFDYDGNAIKYLNGRKLTWSVDKQQWHL